MDLAVNFSETASSYAAAIRLPQKLAQKLAAGSAGDITISLSEGMLQVGEEKFTLTTVAEEGANDCVQRHGDALHTVGAIRDRIIVQQQLDSAARAQVKQRTEQAQRAEHAHHTLNMEDADAAPPTKRPKASSSSKPAPSAKPQQPRAKTSGGVGPARRPETATSTGGARPVQRTGGAHSPTELRTWCLHVLALGPQTLQTLEKQLRSATQRQLVPPAEARLLPKVVAQLAELNESDRYQLPSAMLRKTSPSWKGYSKEQSSTLRALLAAAGVESAHGNGRADGGGGSGGASASADGGEQGEVVISDDAQYRQQKKLFESKYPQYKQLDRQLGQLTSDFEALEDKYKATTPPEARAKAAAVVLQRYDVKKAELEQKSGEYRKLHLELQAIKEAVGKYFEARKSGAS